MARRDTQDIRSKLLPGMQWAGIGLAPLAILVMLFSGGTGGMRVAVTLSVLAVFLLALSVALRPSVDILRAEIEDRVLDEIERVRLHAREDVATAARNTHRVLSDRINELATTVDDMRAHMDEVQASAMLAAAAGGGGAAPMAVGPGVHRTETFHVTRTTTVGQDAPGTVYGGRPTPVDAEWHEEVTTAPADVEDRWAALRADDDRRPALPAGPTPAPPSAAVDRYAEQRYGEQRHGEQRYGEQRYSDRRDEGRSDDRERGRYDDRSDDRDRDRGRYDDRDRDRGRYDDRYDDRDRGRYEDGDRDRARYDDRDRGRYDDRYDDRDRDRGRYDDRYDDRDRGRPAPRPRSGDYDR